MPSPTSRAEQAATALGAPSWAESWADAQPDPQLASLCDDRHREFATPQSRGGDELLTSVPEQRPPRRGFIDAARRAGFVEVDAVRQRFDELVVMAVNPELRCR